MKFGRKPVIFLLLTCVVMMITLAWFTVSLPFVYGAQQKLALNYVANGQAASNDSEEESSNPFANTTEEKTPNSFGSMSEEYLHDSHSSEQYLAAILSKEYKIRHMSTYIAFYGELISPPPDIH